MQGQGYRGLWPVWESALHIGLAKVEAPIPSFASDTQNLPKELQSHGRPAPLRESSPGAGLRMQTDGAFRASCRPGVEFREVVELSSLSSHNQQNISEMFAGI